MTKIKMTIDLSEMKVNQDIFYRFENEDEFDRFYHFNWSGDPSYKLFDEKPLRYPCLLVMGDRTPAKQDEVDEDDNSANEDFTVWNFFVYDFDAPKDMGAGSWYRPGV